MLRIYPVVLETLAALRGLIAQIERRDSDLSRQLRRAAASIVLNLGEGMYSKGKNRQARYHTALGSARETLSCLEVAQYSGPQEGDQSKTFPRTRTRTRTRI